MIPLPDYQMALSTQLMSTLARSGCVILSGRTGFGKRTVAAAAALELGLDFIPIAIDAQARAVCSILLGHEELANPQCYEGGLLLQENACIFLSGCECTDRDLLPILREIFRSRTLRGLELHGQVVILSLCTDSPNPTLREIDQFLQAIPCIRFPNKLGAGDLLQVARNVFEGLSIEGLLEEDHFKLVRLPHQGLGALRKWLLEAAADTGSVDYDKLITAMSSDVVPFVEHIHYRGNQISPEEYFKWASQFDSSVRPIIDHLVRLMVERKYIMSLSDFNGTVDDVVLRSGIPRGQQVVLCEWQPFGKSAPVMAHRVKERGNWGARAIALDLGAEPVSWLKTIPETPVVAILADDFVGTGDSLVQVEPRIRLLLETCPSVSVKILLVAGFAEGIQRVRHLERQYGDRVKVVVGRLLSGDDTCFHDTSSLLETDERQALGAFCDYFGKRVKTKIPRGYGGLGALFAFPESIPNTTLPMFWYDGKPDRWRPLLPASMILEPQVS